MVIAIGVATFAISLARATDSDVASPIVSYQYLDTLAEPGTTIISPVVSYQYFDWPGDENLTFQSSPNISYYFSGGVSLAISGTVRTLGGVPVAGAAITLKRYGTAFWSGTSTANGAFGSANLQAANFTVTVTKPGFTTLVASYGGEAGGNQVVNFWLTAAPAPLPVVATNQTPPGTAVRPPAPACARLRPPAPACAREPRRPECAEADALRWCGAFHHLARRTRSEPDDGGAEPRLEERPE